MLTCYGGRCLMSKTHTRLDPHELVKLSYRINPTNVELCLIFVMNLRKGVLLRFHEPLSNVFLYVN